MAKTLSFTDTSPQTVKIGDTTTSFTLICGNDNVATDLTKATSITVKLGNTSGYLKSATVDPTSLTDPTTGQVTVNFNADLMTSLTAGSYSIEVWVVDSTGTSIYPSDGSTGFTITNNIQSTNGSVITTITFDDFVKELNKAASTIAKGDTGTVDNAGLISAPAFQRLQAQVNNSAVGTNLLIGTSNDLQYYTLKENSDSQGINETPNRNQLANQSLVIGETYTYRANISNVGYAGTTQVAIWDSNSKLLKTFLGNNVAKGEWGYSTCTFEVPENAYFFNFSAIRSSDNIPANTSNLFAWKEEKLEKGSLATDWCPNPSEILTQSDYAKIKAAIVALGGALS